MLISGSEVNAPRLLVSNANGTIGLVGFWDGICFDAFAGKDKKVYKSKAFYLRQLIQAVSF